jgi:FtsP/CotA-like multicopper oxidase with cupredoxin domain
MHRRDFLRYATATGGLISTGGAGALLSACGDPATGLAASAGQARPLLRIPPLLDMDGLVLRARRDQAGVAPGVTSPVMTFGEPAATGGTLVARRGSRARITLLNELDESTIVHWHGLRPPEAADGHPRLAVGPGGRYEYDFEVTDPAGMYWYHSHAHMRTAAQVYSGMAGALVVRDEAEDALRLPSGARELPLLVQDKRLDASGAMVYAPFGPDMMEGMLGDVVFVNGVRSPVAEVDAALYRLRMLNGSNARIFRVGFADGRPLTLIGVDGGFLATPTEVPYVDLGTGERVDVLVDFSAVPVGTRLSLRSLPFTSPAAMGGMGMGMGGMRRAAAQGAQLDIMEFHVVREAADDPAAIPSSLPAPPLADESAATGERTFRFDSMMMNHTINGRSFAMERVDEVVPFGSTEVWTFVNDSPFPHPVHMHAVHFRVLSRTGGRGRLFPWEQGAKDTVLVFPGERVRVVSRFDSHRGLFLLHCHNLEHEDMGMMMNFLIE